MTRPPCGPPERPQRLVELEARLVSLRVRLLALQAGVEVTADDVVLARANLTLALRRTADAQSRAGDLAVTWATRTRSRPE